MAMVLGVIAVGCTGTERPDSTYLVQDSAGIRVVHNSAPLWGDADRWLVAAEPILEIGRASGDPTSVFSQVVGVAKLSDGRYVVADGASSTVRFFGPDGVALRSVGRVGEGPGEYGRISRFAVASGDSIVVMDAQLQRVTVLGPDGSFARSTQLSAAEIGGVARPRGLLSDGRVLVTVLGPFQGLSSGLQRRNASLLVVDLNVGRITQLGEIRGPEEVIEGSRSIAYQFGSDTEIAVSEGGVLVLSTEQALVRQLGLGDSAIQLQFSWPAAPVVVTQELLGAAMEERISRFPAGVPSFAIERLRTRRIDETVAPYLPRARSMVVDIAGNIWVEPFPTPGTLQVSYLVFRPDGVWLGSVVLPAGLKRGTSPRFDPALEIGRDYVLGVWVDELGVELVREYPLERTTPEG